MGAELTDPSYVPLVVGVPKLGRYVVFANHFAEYDDEVYRLDCHPVMRDHPITPIDESDLRNHLGNQTEKTVRNVDFRILDEPIEKIRSVVDRRAKDAEIILFDTLTETHLEKVGETLWKEAQQSTGPLFTVGSSGVEYALSNYLKRGKEDSQWSNSPTIQPVDPIVVMSGSASPVTDDQISWAKENGFALIRLHTSKVVDPDLSHDEIQRAIDGAIRTINDGKSVVIYTSRGSEDPEIDRTRKKATDLELTEDIGRIVGKRQGEILREILLQTNLNRACVSGGDTCSYATPELSIYALEVLSPTAPGSPLCLAHSRDEEFDELQIALKGGQLGQQDYYGRIRDGR